MNIAVTILRLTMGVALILNLHLASCAGLCILLAPWTGLSGIGLALVSGFALCGYIGAWMYVLLPFSKIPAGNQKLYPTIRTGLVIAILFCIFWYYGLNLAYPKEAIVLYGFLLFCAILDIMQQ